MKYSALGYQVANGEKLAEYSYGSGTNVAVLVKVNIAPSASTTVVVSRVDADEDGMADAWETTKFGDLATATHATDFDGDGLLDWQEYVVGMEPKNDQSRLAITNMAAAADSAQIVLQWPSASNRTYSLFGTSNMLAGITNALRIDISATPPCNTHTVDLSAAGATNFFSIGVRLQ